MPRRKRVLPASPGSFRRLGNWSGVGAGKTVSALLAAATIESRLTVIVAYNSTLEAWAQVIANVLPSTRVLWKERGEFEDTKGHTVLLYNYESFQLENSEEVAKALQGQADRFCVSVETQQHLPVMPLRREQELRP